MASVLIVGASRGIGLEWVRQAREAGDRVVATARDEAGLQRLRDLGAVALKLDVMNTASASGLAWQIDGYAFDQVVLVAGVYGPRSKGLQTPTEAEFNTVMQTNVLGPMRVLPQLQDALAPGARLAIMSSCMGSNSLRSNGQGWLYRASKAAVNSVLKDASLLLQDKAVCISVNPGWVRTEMGGEDADIEVYTSVAGMRGVMAALSPADQGSFINYDGERLSW
ncbi:SDR family oxidoreductase [Roseateles sp.]|uniref:SDR family oxidoreductase n=1 Tax=Roseateles sp. TaxID=1971397 RepID=UPI003BA4E68D